MANVICIAGESGSGKTTSLRNLNPLETYIIDADKKGLSWRGWKKQYSLEQKNYYAKDEPKSVLETINDINERRQEIKTLVIDTIGSIMVSD